MIDLLRRFRLALYRRPKRGVKAIRGTPYITPELFVDAATELFVYALMGDQIPIPYYGGGAPMAPVNGAGSRRWDVPALSQ